MRAQKACAWRVQARKRYAHTKGFVDVDLCRRRLRSRLCLWNMHNTQSKARAEGLYVDHPGYCLVRQVGTCCASARCLSLSCLSTLVILEMRHTCSDLAQHLHLPAHAALKTHTSAKLPSADPPQALATRALVGASRQHHHTPCSCHRSVFFGFGLAAMINNNKNKKLIP
jgi:hypothetical protein